MILHILDKNEKLIFTMAGNGVVDSPDCKIVDKKGLAKMILQCNFDSKMEKEIKPLELPKKRDMLDETVLKR